MQENRPTDSFQILQSANVLILDDSQKLEVSMEEIDRLRVNKDQKLVLKTLTLGH